MLNSDEKIVQVLFESIGPDERIHDLNRIVRRRIEGKKRNLGDQFHIILGVGYAANEQKAVALAKRWLIRHCELLASLNARNILEFCTRFRKDDGSRILALEPEFCRLASDSNCVIWHQSCQFIERSTRNH